ncbi:MAG: DMT family transporter [Clostridia bacterium]|nr:DMT family transporter [Clostridia bacterium]
MKFQWKQNGMALTCAFLWGTAFVAQDLCSDLSPFLFNALRSAIAVGVLGLFLLLRRKVQQKKGTYRKQNRKLLWLGGLISGLLLALASNLQQFGISAGSGAGKAGFLTATYVVLVPLIGILFGKKNSFTVWISVGLTLVGLYLLCVKGDFSIAPADLYLVACSVAFALQVIAVDWFVQKVDGIALSWVQFLFMALFSGIFAAFFGGSFSWDGMGEWILPLLYIAIFSNCVAYTLQNLAQKDANPTVVSLIFSLESVFSVVAGALLLQETLLPREYLGCVLMMGAVILSQIPLPVGKKKGS